MKQAIAFCALLLLATVAQAQHQLVSGRATVQMVAVMPESVGVQVQPSLASSWTVQVTSNLMSGHVVEARAYDVNDFLPPAPTVLAGQRRVTLTLPETEFAAMDAKLHEQHIIIIVTPKM
jgi:hypothetical protein